MNSTSRRSAVTFFETFFHHVSTKRFISGVGTTTVSDVEQDYNNAKPFSEIPGPPGLPYLGTLFQFKRDGSRVTRYHDVILERYRKYGKIYRETIAGETVVHLLDPDYIQLVYQNETKIPHIVPLMETTQAYRRLRKMSPGLGNSNGEEWYRLRSAVQRLMLDLNSVSNFLELINPVGDDFIQRIEKGRDQNSGQLESLYNEISKWNLESSAQTCFETRLGCIEAEKNSWQQRMIDANSQIFQLSLKLRFSIPWYKVLATPTWKKLIEMEDFFFRNGQKLVDATCDKIKELQKVGQLNEGQYRFMTSLLSRCDRNELSYEDISIVALSLFADGLSTTTPSLLGQLYCLAKNPDKQEKLYEEITQIAPDRSKPVTNEVIQHATYLKACIKEGFSGISAGMSSPIGRNVAHCSAHFNLGIGSIGVSKFRSLECLDFCYNRIDTEPVVKANILREVLMIRDGLLEFSNDLFEVSDLDDFVNLQLRFFPVGTDVSRIPQKNLVIGGYQVPAGTNLSLNTNMLLREAEYFDQPNQYRPERWVRGVSEQNVHPYLLLPFGFGPRTCAGMRLAEQEMRLVIIKVLQNFRLEWPRNEPDLCQKYVMLLQPNRPSAPIRFIPRT